MLVSQSLNAAEPPSFWRRARSSSDVDRAMETLKRFKIADNSDRLMGEISAGVRKLLDIAMAIAGQPKVMTNRPAGSPPRRNFRSWIW